MTDNKNLNKFLKPFFPSKAEVRDFTDKCLLQKKTKRMLLRSQWYAEIADGMSKIKRNRPALQIIFLMSLGEGVARLRNSTVAKGTWIPSSEMILDFFKFATDEDKKLIARKFKRALISTKHHKLSFSSAVKILWDIRNKAVHGNDFYSFSLLNEERKKEFVDGGYTHYGIITSGFLGKPKRRVSLDISLTYSELRAITIRVALENIRSLFH